MSPGCGGSSSGQVVNKWAVPPQSTHVIVSSGIMPVPSHLMRVVAGVAKGRTLHAPPGRRTRPTSDRVREAIFSILTSMDMVEGAAMLDLFAGTGALGIEALSRGAAAVTFVDSDPEAQKAIRFNLKVLGDRQVRAALVQADVLWYCARAPDVDVVLADPPYSFESWTDLLGLLGCRTQVLVAETGSGWDPAPGWETVKERKYGSTVVTVVQSLSRPQAPVRQEGES
jgi:16S rRNA (guanine966-N2)-methyltransferase